MANQKGMTAHEAADSCQRAITLVIGEAMWPLNLHGGWLAIAGWLHALVEDAPEVHFSTLARTAWKIYGDATEVREPWDQLDPLVQLCMEAAVRHLAAILLDDDRELNLEEQESRWRDWVTSRLDRIPKEVAHG